MIASFLMLLQAMPVGPDSTGPSVPTRHSHAVYGVVVEQLISLFKGDSRGVTESFSDNVEIVVTGLGDGPHTDVGKAAILSMYASLTPLRGGVAKHRYSCKGGDRENICAVIWGERENERRFVVRYLVDGGKIVRVLTRVTSGEAGPVASLLGGEAVHG